MDFALGQPLYKLEISNENDSLDSALLCQRWKWKASGFIYNSVEDSGDDMPIMMRFGHSPVSN